MVSGSIIAPLVNGEREVRKMEKLQERNEFLYKTKALLPYKRKEMIVDMLEKSRALMEQELILDAIYNSMDFKGMNAYDTDKYRKSITQLDDLLNYFRRCS